MTVEEAVDRLEALGFACHYAPDSDIPGGWSCMVVGNGLAVDIPEIIEINEDGWFGVAMGADETGPLRWVSTYLQFEPGHPKEVLDAAAASAFGEIMLAVFVPEDVRPAEPELEEFVAANWPAELGAGWLLGFDRNSISRSMRLVYSEADAEEAP